MKKVALVKNKRNTPKNTWLRTQALPIIIQLIPLEVFIFSALLGWLGFSGMQLVLPPTVVEASDDLLTNAALAVPSQPLMLTTPTLSPVFTPQVQHWAADILVWGQTYQLDPNLIATVMQIESCGAPNVVSKSGAQGLFQVMPFHFAAGENMLDPQTNAQRGLAYLALGLTQSGDAGLALAGYNGGHSVMNKASTQWAAETQRYWYWGTGIYADASQGALTSPRLQEWLAAGGASLCETAAQQLAPK